MTRHSPVTVKVFEKFISFSEDGKVDATRIFSKECYQEWLNTRKSTPKDPAHAFRKALTGHCRGDCGLKPFSPDVEAAILKIIRQKRVWSCFKDSDLKIGLRGFQTLGYWERKRKRSPADEEFPTKKMRNNHLGLDGMMMLPGNNVQNSFLTSPLQFLPTFVPVPVQYPVISQDAFLLHQLELEKMKLELLQRGLNLNSLH